MGSNQGQKLEALKIKILFEFKKNRIKDVRTFQKVDSLKSISGIENYKNEVYKKVEKLKLINKKGRLSGVNVTKTINQGLSCIYGNIEHIYKEAERRIELQVCRKKCLDQIRASTFLQKEELYYSILRSTTKSEIISVLHNLPEAVLKKIGLFEMAEKKIPEEKDLNIYTKKSIRAILTNMKNQ